MIDLSADYWDKRYQNNEFNWDIGSVSTPIKTYIEQLNNKNLMILIPGAGNAYEAEFLHHQGFKNVYVLDFALEPLKNIQTRIPTFPQEHLLQQNFFEHTGQYDLIIEQTFFCALNPSLRKNYIAHMYDLLKPTGKLVGLLFNDPLNIDKPPFGGTKEEYEKLVAFKFNTRILDLCYNSIKPRAGRELFMILQKK